MTVWPGNRYLNTFSIMLPFGAVFVPFTGPIFQRLGLVKAMLLYVHMLLWDCMFLFVDGCISHTIYAFSLFRVYQIRVLDHVVHGASAGVRSGPAVPDVCDRVLTAAVLVCHHVQLHQSDVRGCVCGVLLEQRCRSSCPPDEGACYDVAE